jgi:hypothetical protein
MDRQISMTSERLSAYSPDLGELTIALRPFDGPYCTYVGTRMQLEAEGVIPGGTKWPDAFNSVSWRANGILFSLLRMRPKGAKGPRRDFIDCDHWFLRMELEGRNWVDQELEREAKKLARVVYEHSEEGRAAFMRMIDLAVAADVDEKFQAFKALIPGLIPPPRKRLGRRPKSARQSQDEHHG